MNIYIESVCRTLNIYTESFCTILNIYTESVCTILNTYTESVCTILNIYTESVCTVLNIYTESVCTILNTYTESVCTVLNTYTARRVFVQSWTSSRWMIAQPGLCSWITDDSNRKHTYSFLGVRVYMCPRGVCVFGKKLMALWDSTGVKKTQTHRHGCAVDF